MVEGRCNCGGVKVSMSELPKNSAICYCSNCRRAGSSVGSIVYVLNKPDVKIEDPNNYIKNYTDSDTTSGNSLTRQFCGNCGCPVASLIADESKIILKGGLFEQLATPSYKSFEQEEPSWMKIV
ncbi:Mss4-like protein [Phaeosphaeria sp. MPI-PUGE-AT-0046c]|nr:Mss4-like protein [Phaeosphaeria sp. MPI-PUGE-AT-0046c]